MRCAFAYSVNLSSLAMPFQPVRSSIANQKIELPMALQVGPAPELRRRRNCAKQQGYRPAGVWWLSTHAPRPQTTGNALIGLQRAHDIERHQCAIPATHALHSGRQVGEARKLGLSPLPTLIAIANEAIE